jgi:hypothetical protein
VGQRPLAERCLVRGQNLLRESRLGAHCTARPAALCRIPDYAESSMKHLHLALSWRTETIKPIRHSREKIIGLSGRPTGHRQADSDLLLH